MNKNLSLVAVDDGFAEIKVAWRGQDQAILTLSRPAVARRGVELHDLGGGAVNAYETAGDRFTVFSSATGAEPTRIESYATSSLNRVLVQHSLLQAGFGGRDVVLATGLPVRDFYTRAGKPNVELVNAKISSIRTPVNSLGGDAMANVVATYVYPQGMMAWVDWVTGDDGRPLRERTGNTTAVIDVGGRTTDFAVLVPGDNGAPLVDHGRSGSIDLGVLNIHDALSPLIATRFKAREVSQAKLDEAVRTGKVTAFGVMHDVSDLVAEVSRDVARRLVAETQQRMGSGFDIDAVLYVGGGSVVLAEALSAYSHLQVPPAPALANARGMLKYLTHSEPALRSDGVVQMKAVAA